MNPIRVEEIVPIKMLLAYDQVIYASQFETCHSNIPVTNVAEAV
jgi:hypothetical protein